MKWLFISLLPVTDIFTTAGIFLSSTGANVGTS
jgi:hypothetical protein